MSTKKRVAVLFGGRSGEHEVSLVSAESVMENLDSEKYEVVPIGITKTGKWVAGADALQLLKSGKPADASNALIRPEPTGVVSLRSPEQLEQSIDVVFPVLHGPYGEDGTVQGFLELTGLPYVGCGHLASAICMDKVIQKKILEAEGIPQTPYDWFWASDWKENQTSLVERIESTLDYPLFVKPANLGSSVGIAKAHSREELIPSIEDALRYDRKIIVEQGVKNPKEIECAVLGNQKPRCSVLGEIVPSNEFYDYDAKYVDNKSESHIPADIPAEAARTITETALKAYLALNAEGMARVDFLLSSNGTAYVNELNTIPGFTAISMYPKLWEGSGLSYSELLDELITLAIERNSERVQCAVSYTPKEDWYKN